MHVIFSLLAYGMWLWLLEDSVEKVESLIGDHITI